MSDPKIHLPFFTRLSILFIGIAAFLGLLYVGRPFFVPLLAATLVSVMLTPVVDFLTRRKINRTVAISITVVFGILVILSLAFLISTQVTGFKESIPQMKQNFSVLGSQVKGWVSNGFGLSDKQVDDWWSDQSFLNTGSAAIGKTLMSVGNMLVVAVLLPVYVFLVLYYKDLLVAFVHRLFGMSNDVMVTEVLSSIKTTVKSYLVGLLIEAVIVGVMYTSGLLIIGIDYAVLLGVLAAILNIFPYVGQIIAGSLSVLMALATKGSPTYALIVLGLFTLIQFIDNNFILPRVVASKVKLNALVSIAVIIAGNLLWGVPGMFLAIPLTAICKVIFDEIKPLQTWGFLLGDPVSTKVGKGKTKVVK